MAKVDISKLLKRAEEALNRRNYGLAIFNYIQAVSIQPENIDARQKLRATQTRAYNETGGSGFKALLGLVKANLQSMMGKHEQAMITCENALSQNPTHVGLMRLLAKCAEEAEQIEVAAWQRQEIADKYDEEDTDNLFELAQLNRELGRPSAAIQNYERILEIDPGYDISQELRDTSAEMTSDTYASAVERGSHDIVKDKDEAEFLELDSNKLKTDDQRKKAISYILEHQAKERPDDHRVFIQLGDISYDMEDWKTGYAEAKKYYEKARELNSTDSVVRDKLGDTEIKNLRVNLRALQAQAKNDPNDADVKKRYKALNRKRLDFEVTEYERRTKDQPLKAIFHYRLGELYFQTKRFDDAIGELQQASKDPKFKISALTMLGRSFHAMEQFDMALTQFRRAREGEELFDKIKDSLYYEALTHEAKGEPESLKESLRLFTEIYETDINYRDVKKKVPELQKKIKEAAAT